MLSSDSMHLAAVATLLMIRLQYGYIGGSAFAADSPQVTKIGASPSNVNVSFNPCMPSRTVTAAAKVRMAKLVTSVLGTCGFKIIASIKYGLGKEFVNCVHYGLTNLCILMLVPYGWLGEEVDRLPPAIAANASILYDYAYKSVNAICRDSSISDQFCCRKSGTQPTCYPKRVLGNLFLGTWRCVQHTMKDAMPEKLEDNLFALFYVAKKVTSGGLLDYLMG